MRIVISIIVCLLLFVNDSNAQASNAGSYQHLSFHHTIVPVLTKPFEVGISYNHSFNERWGLSYNYRIGFAKSKERPRDLENFKFSFSPFGSNVDDNEIIHTFALRAIYRWPILQNLNWRTEFGPAYLRYINKSFIVPTHFSSYNYQVVNHPYNMLGLSIQNSISISKNRTFNLYVYNCINSKFSHTVIGIQYNIGNAIK